MSTIDDAHTLYQAGRLAEAETLCRELLGTQPANFPLVNLLGIICARSGRLPEAAQLFGQAVELNPYSAFAHANLGNVLRNLGSSEAALESYGRALALEANHLGAHIGRGNTLRELRQYEAALASYDAAARLDPNSVDVHYNRGNVLQDLKRPADAVASYSRALTLRPDHALAHNGRGVSLLELKQFEAALESVDAALKYQTDHPEAHNNRGLALAGQQRYQEALAAHDKAIALKPDFADAHCSRGYTLYRLREYEAAIASYDRAIALNPQSSDYHWYRGNALRDMRKYVEAGAAYNTAFALNPQREGVRGLRQDMRMQVCDWAGFDEEVQQLADGILRDEAVSEPFSILTLLDAPAVQRRAARIWTHLMHAQVEALPAIPRHPSHERLKLGYFSADFRNHAVAALTAELFETHDRSRFEVTAFSFGPDEGAGLRPRLEAAFEHFLDVRDQSDREIALLARSLEIDIAVDLGGYSGECRPGIFAARAAPLQVSYLGYLGTMSADFMDYLVADATIVPEASREHYSEAIVYLPSYQANDSKRPVSLTDFTREELGLPPAGFVFCCFNTPFKITPAVFAGWMRVLGRVPGSVLFLLAHDETTQQNLRQAAHRSGVDAERLVFGGRLTVPEYMARFRAADLFLDTLPYNAGTTASDALWAGLPVLTRIGEGFPARVASSLLRAIGLEQLITRSQEEYENLAVELATQPQRLRNIRRELQRNRLTTRLFNTRAHTRSLEDAYLKMQARQVAGLPPEHIHVEPG